VTEILHGVPITDPYRWLEDQNSLRTRKWLGEQTAYTRAYLDAIPGRDHIRERLKQLLAVDLVSQPSKIGTRYFFMKRAAHRERSVIMMREGEAGEDIPLVDPADRSEDPALALDILNISQDGKYIAYGVRNSGENACAVEFLDVDQKRIMPDRLPRGVCGGVVFSRDGRGFYYSHPAIDSVRPRHRTVYWHDFGPSLDGDPEIFFAGDDPRLHLSLLGSPDGQVLAYLVLRSENPMTTDCWIQCIASGGLPQRIVEGVEGGFYLRFIDNKLIALTEWDAPNGRIVEIDPARPGLSNCREIVPESDSRIHGFTVVRDLIFVTYVENLTTKVQSFDLAGNSSGTLPVPLYSSTAVLSKQSQSDTLFYRTTSFHLPPTIFRFDPHTCQSQVWASRPVPFDPSSFESERVEYESKDGTRIPMFLVAKKGCRCAGSIPTFLTGYGGFGSSLTPKFTAYGTVLMEQGFLFAVANLRGGAEFGEQWHLAAMRHHRQNAIDDFISAAEWLLAHGHTSPGRLAIGGGSNAGLLVGAALTQRPDLFRAVLCLGPLLDMLRYHKFDHADLWVEEYGCSENLEDFPYLYSYSPYQQAKDNVSYPAVMLISGDADTCCNPMHARKMAARLQSATSSSYPILLDYKSEWGHVPVLPLSCRIDSLTDRLAFICHELGVDV